MLRYTRLMGIGLCMIVSITGFWRGVTPNIFRNAVINCCELATFD
jgi:hypothetical protein